MLSKDGYSSTVFFLLGPLIYHGLLAFGTTKIEGAEHTNAHIPREDSSAIERTIAFAGKHTRNFSSFDYLHGLRKDGVDPAYHGGYRLLLPKQNDAALVYLSFIIDNYDNLPDYSFFFHGHDEGLAQDHDAGLETFVKDLRSQELEKEGFVSLPCEGLANTCPWHIGFHSHSANEPEVHKKNAALVDVWQGFFPEISIPDTLERHCCAQFAVTKKAIRSRSRHEYYKWKARLVKTELDDDMKGQILTKLWPYILTRKALSCYDPHSCPCRFFGRCSAPVNPMVTGGT